MKSIGMVVVGFALVACGGGGGLGQPIATFPSRADLEDVMESRAKPVSTLKTVDVPSWRIETPVPAPGAPYPNATIWDSARLCRDRDSAVLRRERRFSGRRNATLLCRTLWEHVAGLLDRHVDR
jgi:hypothetical protein